jgi:hypothetical protein
MKAYKTNTNMSIERSEIEMSKLLSNHHVPLPVNTTRSTLLINNLHMHYILNAVFMKSITLSAVDNKFPGIGEITS